MNFVKNNFLGNYAAFLCLMLIILMGSSCQKDTDFPLQEDQEETRKQELVMEYLIENDYDLEAVEFKADIVKINDNVGYLMEDLLKVIEGEVVEENFEDPDAADIISSADIRQRGVSEANRLNAVTKQNVQSILYHIRPSVSNDCGNSWVNAVNNAATTWNNVSNCRVIFESTSNVNAADIIVASENDLILPVGMRNLPNPVFAFAQASFNGAAGRFISIADNHDLLFSKQRVTLNMFGITLGFTHTGGTDGQHIHGTPTTQNNSIMNPSWSSGSTTFQSGDLRMARIYYPNSFSTPNSFNAFRLNSNTVRITYRNQSASFRPYYWVRLAKYTASGALIQVRYVRSTTSTTTGLHTVDWSGHSSGLYRFALRGCNFRRDVWSHRTNQIFVNF